MGVRKLAGSVLLIWVMILAITPPSAAQVNAVNLSGTVLDPQNLAVQGAKLTLQNSGKGVSRVATSDANGRYEFVGVPPGIYSLTVDAPGFATLTRYFLYPDSRASR